MNTPSTFEEEVRLGKRFEFGKNWQSFLTTLNDERIETAKESLTEMLGIADLSGKRFLDIGSGSGLFSLAARKLGASVVSFDFDPTAVACAQELRSRFFPDDSNWEIHRGSVLDTEFLGSLGEFDIVYSWGVLHHTGEMWNAIQNAASQVKQGGLLYIAIYNDQDIQSTLWLKVKEIYCSGTPGKLAVSAVFMPYFFLRACLVSAIRKKNMFANYRRLRGMSITHDWKDWLGGLPFEVAKVEEVFHFARANGFVLQNLKTTNALGCNQFVFSRSADPTASVQSKPLT